MGRFFPLGMRDLARQTRYFRSDLMIQERYQVVKNRLKNFAK